MKSNVLTLEDVLLLHEEYGMTLQISNGKVTGVYLELGKEKGEKHG